MQSPPPALPQEADFSSTASCLLRDGQLPADSAHPSMERSTTASEVTGGMARFTTGPQREKPDGLVHRHERDQFSAAGSLDGLLDRAEIAHDVLLPWVWVGSFLRG